MQFQDEAEDEFWCAALNSALRRGCRTSTVEAVHIADSALEAYRARQPQEAGPEPKYGLPHPLQFRPRDWTWHGGSYLSATWTS